VHYNRLTIVSHYFPECRQLLIDEFVIFRFQAGGNHELGARSESHKIKDQLRHLLLRVMAAQLSPFGGPKGCRIREERLGEAQDNLLAGRQVAARRVLEIFDCGLVEPAIDGNVQAQVAEIVQRDNRPLRIRNSSRVTMSTDPGYATC
jgi:hypothetical protein